MLSSLIAILIIERHGKSIFCVSKETGCRPPIYLGAIPNGVPDIPCEYQEGLPEDERVNP
jgi:hypothetical protein